MTTLSYWILLQIQDIEHRKSKWSHEYLCHFCSFFYILFCECKIRAFLRFVGGGGVLLTIGRAKAFVRGEINPLVTELELWRGFPKNLYNMEGGLSCFIPLSEIRENNPTWAHFTVFPFYCQGTVFDSFKLCLKEWPLSNLENVGSLKGDARG